MSTADRAVFRARPDVIGHRGLGKGTVDGHVENTPGSVAAAAACGVDWVEVDATRTADDVLVAHHNPAMLDSSGMPDDAFLVELASGDLARAGVQRLDDVLAALPVEVGVDLDLKPVLEDALRPVDAGVAGLLLPLLRRESGRRRMLVTSFDPAGLLWLREQVPGLALGLLSWLDFPLRIAVPTAAHLGFDVVGLHHRSFASNPVEPGPVHRSVARNVEVAHAAGLEVLAWCPGEPEVGALVAAGVDAVVVNDVPRLLAAVRRSRRSRRIG
jgi:glycerophosphoryl diester phosphodiesterase